MHLKRQLARLGVGNDGGPQNGWAVLVYIVSSLQCILGVSLMQHFTLCRLVMVDVAFYTENVQALRSLERLDLNMPEIWEQKRWWRTSPPGQLGLSATPAITATCSTLSRKWFQRVTGNRKWGDSGLKVLFIYTSVTPESSGGVSRSARLCPHWERALFQDIFIMETKRRRACVVDQSCGGWELWEICLLFWSGDVYAVPPSVLPLQCNFLLLCNSVCYLISVKWKDEWLFIWIVLCWFIWFVFPPKLSGDECRQENSSSGLLKFIFLHQCNDDFTACFWLSCSWMLN